MILHQEGCFKPSVSSGYAVLRRPFWGHQPTATGLTRCAHLCMICTDLHMWWGWKPKQACVGHGDKECPLRRRRSTLYDSAKDGLFWENLAPNKLANVVTEWAVRACAYVTHWGVSKLNLQNEAEKHNWGRKLLELKDVFSLLSLVAFLISGFVFLHKA